MNVYHLHIKSDGDYASIHYTQDIGTLGAKPRRLTINPMSNSRVRSWELRDEKQQLIKRIQRVDRVRVIERALQHIRSL